MGKRSFCISSNEVAVSHFLILLVAGTGALVMALRGVELISNGKADVARVVVAVLGALYAVAVHRPALRTALEDVVAFRLAHRDFHPRLEGEVKLCDAFAVYFDAASLKGGFRLASALFQGFKQVLQQGSLLFHHVVVVLWFVVVI